MATSTGTVATGTTATATAELYARDTELISAFGKAATVATAAAIKYQSTVGALALTILDLHEAGTWARQIDGNTGQTYTSPKAFYADLFNRTDKNGHRLFSPLHKSMRDELMAVLIDDNGKLAGIGTNELAELIGCSPAQVSRSVAGAAEAKAIEAATPVDLDKVAEEAKAAALADGADEKAAAYAAEAARAEAKAAAEAAAEAASKPDPEAEAKAADAKAKAEAKAADKAGKVFIGAVTGVHDTYHLMTEERQAEVLKAARELVVSLEAFEVGQAQYRADQAAAVAKAAATEAAAVAKAAASKPGNRRTTGKAS